MEKSWKRPQIIAANQQTKRQKTGNSEKQPEQMNIKNLGIDCLEKIFMFFDLENLLSVAHVCKQFEQATKYPFIRKYSKKTIELYAIESSFWENKPFCNLRGNNLEIRNLKMMMQILRIFGSSISDLRFHCLKSLVSEERFDHIYYPFILQINQFCANSLKKINMDNAIGFDALDLKPFTKVEFVKIGTCLLESHCLNKLFPRIRQLKVYFEVEPKNRGTFAITEHFLHLEDLIICMSRQTNIFRADMVNALQLNPQIRRLKIEMKDLSILKEIRNPIPSLEYFKYTIFIEHFIKFRGKSIKFPNVKIFKIEFYARNKRVLFPRIPFLFNELKECTVVDNVCLQSNNKYDNFIKKNSSLEKLIYISFGQYNEIESYDNILKTGLLSKSKLKKSLPLLNEIVFKDSDHLLSIDEVIQYTVGFQSIKYFSFYCKNDESDIRERFSGEWQITKISPIFSNYFVALERIQ